MIPTLPGTIIYFILLHNLMSCMKNKIMFVFLSVLLIGALPVVAQTDSAALLKRQDEIRKNERELNSIQKEVEKKDKKVQRALKKQKKREKRMKRAARKAEKQQRKKEKQLKKLQKQQGKLDELKNAPLPAPAAP